MTDQTKTPAPGADRGGRDEGALPGQAARYPNTESRLRRQGPLQDLTVRTARGDVFHLRIDASDPHWRAKALAAVGDPLSPIAFAICALPMTQAEAAVWADFCRHEDEAREIAELLRLRRELGGEP